MRAKYIDDSYRITSYNVCYTKLLRLFDELKEPAQRLGSAFQKVNFLRDLKADVHQLRNNFV